MSSDPSDARNRHFRFIIEPVFTVHPETGELVQVSSGIDEFGREVPDSVPMSPPVEMSAGPSLIDQIKRMVRVEMSQAASDGGYETFEEADDFEVEDDPLDPHTPYEAVFDPVGPVGDSPAMRQRILNLRAEADRLERDIAAAAPAPKAPDPPPKEGDAKVGDGKDSSPKPPPPSSEAKSPA